MSKLQRPLIEGNLDQHDLGKEIDVPRRHHRDKACSEANFSFCPVCLQILIFNCRWNRYSLCFSFIREHKDFFNLSVRVAWRSIVTWSQIIRFVCLPLRVWLYPQPMLQSLLDFSYFELSCAFFISTWTYMYIISNGFSPHYLDEKSSFWNKSSYFHSQIKCNIYV